MLVYLIFALMSLYKLSLINAMSLMVNNCSITLFVASSVAGLAYSALVALLQTYVTPGIGCMKLEICGLRYTF